MKLFILAAITVVMLGINGASALTIDTETGNNSDGTAKFSDPDNKDMNFEGAANQFNSSSLQSSYDSSASTTASGMNLDSMRANGAFGGLDSVYAEPYSGHAHSR